MKGILSFRKAVNVDLDRILEILQQAIHKRKEEGSKQWQNGYPNKEVIKDDLINGYGYVIVDELHLIIGYLALIDREEPAYNNLVGSWLSDKPYLVIHRLAIAQDVSIKGIGTWTMKEVEHIALLKGIHSIKVDTNFDNLSMLRILEKLGYKYCGEVHYDGDPRKAYEKLL
ncbi:GNAT family N-acetyltransferase [Empedobacter falsenii]